MLHAYIALEDRAAMEECMATLKERCPTLSCTLVVPESGVRVEPASGWASQLGQDLGGELVNGLVVRDGLTGDSGARTLAPEDDAPAGYPVAGTTLATQDLAELLVQLAIQAERATPAGEVRVLRVSPYKGAFQAGAIRPGYRVKIGGLTGEKAGKLNGEVASVVERAEVGDGWVVLTDPEAVERVHRRTQEVEGRQPRGARPVRRLDVAAGAVGPGAPERLCRPAAARPAVGRHLRLDGRARRDQGLRLRAAKGAAEEGAGGAGAGGGGGGARGGGR